MVSLRVTISKMQIDLAIIGGTGVGSRLAELPGRSLFVHTAGGPLRGRIVQFGGAQVLAIQRHAAGHATPPHKVNYAAFALGLKALGVKNCIATAAVGCMHLDWPIGRIVPCTDFIDASGRNITLFDSKVVHTAMESPFGGGSGFLRQAQNDPNLKRAIYVQANGPRYETSAEIHAYARMDADIVGMTAASEAVVMGEAGIHYECLAVVTNYAAGLGKDINHGAVGDVMLDRSKVIFAVLERAANLIAEQRFQPN